VIYQRAIQHRTFRRREIALLLGAALFLFAANAVGGTIIVAILAVVIILGVIAFRMPVWTAVFFVAFTPVNRFVIQATFHLAGLEGFSSIAGLWRDALLGILCARVIYDAFFSTTPKRLRYLDILVLFFVGLSAAYLVYPGTQETDALTRIQGFRTDSSFMLAYFVGRSLRLSRPNTRWLVLAIVPGSVLVAVVAVWQFAAPASANGVFDALGLREARERDIAGVGLIRASSLLLGDLALSFYQIVLVALASALLFHAKNTLRRWLAGGFLVAMIGTLILTVTRSSIIAAVPVVVIAAQSTRAYGRLAVLTAVCLAVGLAFVVASGLEPEHLQRLTDPGEASAQARLIAAAKSFDIVQDNPLGQGLGTAGTIGQRYLGAAAITNESWYLQLATEMGPLVAVLYVAIVLMTMVLAFLAYRNIEDVWLRVLALTVATAAIGFLIVGNFLHAWENTVLSMVYWLYAGVAVRARELEASWTRR